MGTESKDLSSGMVSKRFLRMAEHDAYNNGYFEDRYGNVHWHLKSIEDILPERGRAVDLGCGKGAGSINLASRGFSVVAIDINGKKLAYATGKTVEFGIGSVSYVRASKSAYFSYPKGGDVLYVEGDIKSDLYLPDDSVDLVTFFHVYPAFPKDGLEICKQGARVLKTNGLFVVTVDRETSLNPLKTLLFQAGLYGISVSKTPNLVDRHWDQVDKYLLVARK